jgi:hypothetical protein
MFAPVVIQYKLSTTPPQSYELGLYIYINYIPYLLKYGVYGVYGVVDTDNK